MMSTNSSPHQGFSALIRNFLAHVLRPKCLVSAHNFSVGKWAPGGGQAQPASSSTDTMMQLSAQLVEQRRSRLLRPACYEAFGPQEVFVRLSAACDTIRCPAVVTCNEEEAAALSPRPPTDPATRRSELIRITDVDASRLRCRAHFRTEGVSTVRPPLRRILCPLTRSSPAATVAPLNPARNPGAGRPSSCASPSLRPWRTG